MITYTYKELFGFLKTSCFDLKGRIWWYQNMENMNASEYSRLVQQLQILCRAEIAQHKDGVFTLHPKQIKPVISVVEIPAITALPSDLGHVRAMLTARGFSSGSYAGLAESETRYQIEISSDPNKSMKLWISKVKCERVEAARKAAA